MSDEPLATKSQPPSAIADADYDIIYATVSETAQGRRFLAEHARRCRVSDTETSLAAVERMQAVMREGGASDRLQLLLEIADMAQAIVRLRAEILTMKLPGGGPLDTTEELDSIVQTTESATSRILASAEQVQEIAWTMRETGSIEALCDEIDKQVTEIYTACSFQDLTGQRTQKIVQVLRYLEERLNVLVGSQSAGPAAEEGSSLVQAGVDAVMGPDFFPPQGLQQARQDATLEDISREMLAIEPMIGLPPAPAGEHSGQDEPRPEDARPELSVADAVMAEGQNTSFTDWVVEDPNGARPEAEPAWMILRRLEEQQDQPVETKSAATSSDPPPQPPPAEPALFVAEAMSQLAQELRPASLLPPPELTSRGKITEPRPLTELATTMANTAIRLRQPDDDAERQAAPQAALSASSPPRAAENEAPAAASDPDDFLFAPEAETPQRAETAGPPAEEWKAGTYPNPALVTPQALPPQQADSPSQKDSSSYDPLAPLRAMSDEQKIALFS